MKTLFNITPAETILIKECNAAELKEMMKFTFMDLLLKKVIEIKEICKKPHPRDPYIRKYTYVIAGKNFEKYTPKNHELIYLSPFIKAQSIEILFSHFIKMVYDSSSGSWNFKKLIRNNLHINPYFKKTFFLNLFRQIKLTNKGISTKNEITNYLNQIDKDIDNLLHNDKKEGLELLLSIGGNIFLLKNLDFELLKKIDKELINKQKAVHNIDYESNSDWFFYLDSFEDNHSYGSYFNSFDSALDSFDCEFDAFSCSSCDSGCSSCGGCGGCD